MTTEQEQPQECSPAATQADLAAAVSEIKSSMPSSGIGFIGVMLAMFLMHSCTASDRDAPHRETQQQLQEVEMEVQALRKEVEQLRKLNDQPIPPLVTP
jgi:cell division protein ZapA (FtsZ GTPase activity inhibitor)